MTVLDELAPRIDTASKAELLELSPEPSVGAWRKAAGE